MREYDAIVVGGGVNGCGLVRDLALRGLRAALVEKGDLGVGASGHSSGMIHGGPRYLASEAHVTRLSCEDAGHIRRIAPHLTFRVPFLLPLLRGQPRLLHEGIDAYFAAYDEFQPLKGGRPHARLTAAEARRIEPDLSERVVGAIAFDEWGIDGARLCQLNALDARERGCDVLLGCAATGLVRDGARVTGVVARDPRAGRELRLSAPVVVNVAGAWAPRLAAMAGATVRVRPGKGIHIVYPRRHANYGVMSVTIDGRWIFVEPHQNGSLLGTTDTDCYGDPDDLRVTGDEVAYLLQAIERVLPGIRRHRPIATTAGLRPTLFRWGVHPDALSRDHAILDHEAEGAPGLVSMVGGKLASYRAMTAELGDAVVRRLGRGGESRAHEEPLPGGDGAVDPEDLARRFAVPALAAVRLAARQGTRAVRVLDAAGSEGRAIVCPCEPVLRAEVRAALRVEDAGDLCGVRRRTRLGEGTCQGTLCLGRAAALVCLDGGATARAAQDALCSALDERWRAQAPVLPEHAANAAQLELSRARYFLVGDLARRPWAAPAPLS